MISSVRDVLTCLVPNSMPRTGMRFRYGIPPVDSVLDSRMAPPMATVSPSCIVSCVLMERLENDGESPTLVDDDPAKGALTCWLTIIVTTPLELMCARMFSVTPVLWLLTPWTSCELPPVTPDKPVEVATGTWLPTFMVAGTLSVAMILGEEITLEREVFSDAFSRPSSCLLLPTIMPAVSDRLPEDTAASACVAPEIAEVAPSDCSSLCTPSPKLVFRGS